jgi:hypothetical protein
MRHAGGGIRKKHRLPVASERAAQPDGVRVLGLPHQLALKNTSQAETCRAEIRAMSCVETANIRVPILITLDSRSRSKR